MLDAGVSFYMSTSSLAAGVGVLAEEYAPYCNAEGNDLREGDWTLPEAERFSQSFELKDTNILPNPTVMDSGGDFIYRPEAADAMKSKLLKGHAIAITYYADQSMPEMSREDLRAILENALYAYGDYYTEEDIEFYLDAATGVTDLSALSREELEYLIKLRAGGLHVK